MRINKRKNISYTWPALPDILKYIESIRCENNIFNADKKTIKFFETNGINKLATYSFHERIYNFDPEFNCEESNDVAKKIYEMTKK